RREIGRFLEPLNAIYFRHFFVHGLFPQPVQVGELPLLFASGRYELPGRWRWYSSIDIVAISIDNYSVYRSSDKVMSEAQRFKSMIIQTNPRTFNRSLPGLHG
ncbi:MAG: hypothetical protein WAN14_12865, partial [Candidatus Acidiferrales bacterium]